MDNTKWGTPPAVAGEPDFYTVCARYEDGGEAGWIPLPGYSNETEHGVKHLVLEAARKEGYKGTAAGRLLELGWEIRPVFLTPQPTQAQSDTQCSRNPFYHGPRNCSRGTVGCCEDHGAKPQAQAGAVPLDEARRLFDAGWKAAALFCDREDVVADGIIGFGACPQFEAAFSAANGIKGGQHG